MLRILFQLIVVMFVWIPLNSAAQNEIGNDVKNLKNKAIQIVADRMVVNRYKKTVVFMGNVSVTCEDLRIYGKKLTVYGKTPDSTSKQNLGEQIERIEITGDVKVIKGDKVIVAGKAVFYRKDGKIVLTEHPQLTQGRNRVSGERVVLYMKDERVIIEGTEQSPVQAVLYPKAGR